MKMFQSSDDRITAAERASRDQRQAEREHTRLESIQARCVRCIDCTGHDKRLTVSVGEHAYLRVKPSERILLLLTFIKGSNFI